MIDLPATLIVGAGTPTVEKKFGCVRCEYNSEFNDNSQDCQSGSILRFFNWSVEQLQGNDALDVDGNIFFYFKILGVNIPQLDSSMPGQVENFINTSLVAEFQDTSIEGVDFAFEYVAIRSGGFLTSFG